MVYYAALEVVCRCSDVEAWRFGGMEIWRHGDLEAWCSDVDAWMYGGLKAVVGVWTWRLRCIEVWSFLSPQVEVRKFEALEE